MDVFKTVCKRRATTQTTFLMGAVCLLTSFFLSGKAHASEEIILSTRDGERLAIVLPVGRGPQPTVLVLHGAMGTADLMVSRTSFDEVGRRHHFTIVFPEGLKRQWNDGRFHDPDRPDDVAFLRKLTHELIERRIAKPGHIYIAGISNGAAMSFTMACRVGRLFRGIGTVINSMPAGMRSCRLHSVPLVMVAGTADPLVPYAGGRVGFRRERGKVLGMEETAQMFARKNGCRSRRTHALPDRDRTDGSTVTRVTWGQCRTGKPVTLYRVEGGGHQIPGGRTLMPLLLGRTNHDISAAEVIMKAFAREEARISE
ncbi:MAG: PHB depolymerase family esterase [Alphaproteobacteria bacterium]